MSKEKNGNSGRAGEPNRKFRVNWWMMQAQRGEPPDRHDALNRG